MQIFDVLEKIVSVHENNHPHCPHQKLNIHSRHNSANIFQKQVSVRSLRVIVMSRTHTHTRSHIKAYRTQKAVHRNMSSAQFCFLL